MQLFLVSSGVKGKDRKTYLPWSGRQKALVLFNSIFMKFILIANTKQWRDPFPGLSGDNSEVSASGLLPVAVYMSAERSFAHSWFPNIQAVAHLTSPVTSTCSSAVWA